MAREEIDLTTFIQRLQSELKSPNRIFISEWFRDHLPFLIGPSISSFAPISGQPGTLVTIHGHQFSTTREDNAVEVGGQPAYVVAASSTDLKVITAENVVDGPVKVAVGEGRRPGLSISGFSAIRIPARARTARPSTSRVLAPASRAT